MNLIAAQHQQLIPGWSAANKHLISADELRLTEKGNTYDTTGNYALDDSLPCAGAPHRQGRCRIARDPPCTVGLVRDRSV